MKIQSNGRYGWSAFSALLIGIASVALAADAFAGDGDEENEEPLPVALILIELTEDDIELQAFGDGPNMKRFQIEDPRGRRIFDLRPQRRLRRQGLSEVIFASNPDDFPVDPDGEIDPEGAEETIRAFLRRFPAGEYEMEARTPSGELEGEALLTHVLPDVPEITSPAADGEDPPVVDPNNLVVEWEPVTTQFLNNEPVEVVEYRITIDQEEPEREEPQIEGGFSRRSSINVPGSVTELSVPPEFLIPGALYSLEVMAVEISGNTTIAETEFATMDE